jgi:hypothetical protein
MPAAGAGRGAFGLRRFIGAFYPYAKAALKPPQSKRSASCYLAYENVLTTRISWTNHFSRNTVKIMKKDRLQNRPPLIC